MIDYNQIIQETDREVTFGSRTLRLIKDPVHSMWRVVNKANSYEWPGRYTTYDQAVLGAKKIVNEMDAPVRPKKVHLQPKKVNKEE